MSEVGSPFVMDEDYLIRINELKDDARKLGFLKDKPKEIKWKDKTKLKEKIKQKVKFKLKRHSTEPSDKSKID
jgi:hypothetical protein